MKTLWTAISILAVAHLLAFLGFTGYLVGTDRVNRARLDDVRAMFAVTIEDERAQQLEAEEAAQTEAAKQAHLASMNDPNLGAGARNQEIKTLSDVLMEERRRAEADQLNLSNYLDDLMADVEQARAQLEADRAQFEAERDRLSRAETDAQFKQTADIFGGLSAEQQKALVEQYLARGEDELVVDLLDTLDKRKATGFFEQFETPEDQIVAADLLMRLKDRGITVSAASN